MLDRIDLHITVPKLKADELLQQESGELSESIRERVLAARDIQTERYGKAKVNGGMSPKDIRNLVGMDKDCEDFMRLVTARMNLSARVFDRLLKVARTIADLGGSEPVTKQHLSEAVQYRGDTA